MEPYQSNQPFNIELSRQANVFAMDHPVSLDPLELFNQPNPSNLYQSEQQFNIESRQPNEFSMDQQGQPSRLPGQPNPSMIRGDQPRSYMNNPSRFWNPNYGVRQMNDFQRGGQQVPCRPDQTMFGQAPSRMPSGYRPQIWMSNQSGPSQQPNQLRPRWSQPMMNPPMPIPMGFRPPMQPMGPPVSDGAPMQTMPPPIDEYPPMDDDMFDDDELTPVEMIKMHEMMMKIAESM